MTKENFLKATQLSSPMARIRVNYGGIMLSNFILDIGNDDEIVLISTPDTKAVDDLLAKIKKERQRC